MPVADRHLDYCHKVEAELKSEGVRAQVDARSERIDFKIRQAQLEKVPYMLVVGDKEVASTTVSVRLRTGEQLPSCSVDDFRKGVRKVIVGKLNELRLRFD